MKFFRSLPAFFVYSNLFIAGCAVLMVHQTYQLILHEAVNRDFILFVFFSTICSYSFHWYLTAGSVLPSPRIDWISRYRIIHLVFFITGLAGAAIMFFFLLPHWHWLLLSAVITFLYSAPKIPHPLFRSLRKIALGKTIFLAMVWMMVTSFLPIVISDQSWKMDFTLWIIARFFLIYAICILFDYRDREDDKASGIRSLITYLNEKQIGMLFAFSISVFFITTVLLSLYHYSWKSIIILLIPGIIVAFLYERAKQDFHDMFYYFALDGLMAFSALIMLITGI